MAILFEKIKNDEFVIDGKLSIRDFNKYVEINLPETQNKSIGGYLWHSFGSKPKINDSIDINNYRFTVKSHKGKTIGKIHLIKLIVNNNNK